MVDVRLVEFISLFSRYLPSTESGQVRISWISFIVFHDYIQLSTRPGLWGTAWMAALDVKRT